MRPYGIFNDQKDMIMANVFNDSAVGGGYGGGVPFGIPAFGGFGGGGDGLGIIALLALLGGRGFGRDGGDNCDRSGGDSNAAVIAALSALNNRNDDDCCEITALMSKLASIEGAIPAVGSSLQLALANLAAGLTAQNNTNTQTVTTQLGQLQLGQLVQSNAIQNAIAGVDTNVDRSTTLITNAIGASEARLANLINDNTIQDLRDKVVIQANQLAEERSERNRDRDRHGVEVTTIVNQQQNAIQFQKIENDNERFRNLLLDLVQVNRATNQAINIGAGTQTANPLNSQTNVKG
jgi:hypothetical protein